MSEATNQTEPLSFDSFAEFYPYYLSEHRDVNCRRLHFLGSTGVLAIIVFAVLSANPWWLLLMPVCGYGFAWVGHFAFERNKPATFNFPLYSLIGDWAMYADILRGRISLLR